MPWWAGLWQSRRGECCPNLKKKLPSIYFSQKLQREFWAGAERPHLTLRIWTARGTLAEIRAELIKSRYSKQEEYFPFEAEIDPSPTGLQPAPPQWSFGLWHMNKWMNIVRTGVAVLLLLRSYWGDKKFPFMNEGKTLTSSVDYWHKKVYGLAVFYWNIKQNEHRNRVCRLRGCWAAPRYEKDSELWLK